MVGGSSGCQRLAVVSGVDGNELEQSSGVPRTVNRRKKEYNIAFTVTCIMQYPMERVN